MSPMQVTGLALIVVGAMDFALASFVIGPRVRDPRARRLMQATLYGGGALFLAVGILMLTGRMGGFGPP